MRKGLYPERIQPYFFARSGQIADNSCFAEKKKNRKPLILKGFRLLITGADDGT